MKVRAAVLERTSVPAPYSDSLPLSIEEVELDPPGQGEVLVKIAAAGLCHSDLSAINGDRPKPLPLVLGHEGSGVVEEVGAGVDDLKKGDHVVLVFMPSCGICLPCAEGRPALCEPAATANAAGTLLAGVRRLKRSGSFLNHHLGCSTFAEYSTVSRRSLVKIEPDLPIETAALFGCAVLTGMGAVLNTARVTAGSTVAIVGLGGVGLSCLLGAVLSGAREIVAVDLAASKLGLARELGATMSIDATNPDCQEQIRDKTGGGVDFAFEMAGSAEAMKLAYNITRRGGTTVTASLPHASQQLGISHIDLVVEERTLKGSYHGSCVPTRDLPRYLSLYRQGRLPIERLISARISLMSLNRAFDDLREGKAVRQLVLNS